MTDRQRDDLKLFGGGHNPVDLLIILFLGVLSLVLAYALFFAGSLTFEAGTPTLSRYVFIGGQIVVLLLLAGFSVYFYRRRRLLHQKFTAEVSDALADVDEVRKRFRALRRSQSGGK